MEIKPVILSGGSGTRLWPLSRQLYPKQLLPLLGENSLLQDTVLRLRGFDGCADAVTVICNEEHRFLVAEQLRELSVPAQSIILEPMGRNTAPALTLAALSIQQHSEDGLMLVMPADHVIGDIAAFHQSVLQGKALAGQGYIVTFGIVPDKAETGYGYIEQGADIDNGACAIARFVEKPDAATAQSYLQAGNFLWNSGMFLLTAKTWLQQIKLHNPEIYNQCEQAYRQGQQDQDFYRINKDAFAACPSDSIDYAVMEKLLSDASGKAAVVPFAANWSDVGAWSAIWELSEKDEQGNVTTGDAVLLDSKDSMMISHERLIAGVGLSDTIVIETADAVLVADKNRVQDVKNIVETLKQKQRDEYLNHRKVYRPWGTYETIDVGQRYQVKRITVNPAASLSLQMHHHRAEHWIVVKGTAKVTRGEDVFLVSENESTYIPIGTKHRLENPGAIALEMIEVQSGSYLGEDDIVRFEDIYGRSN